MFWFAATTIYATGRRQQNSVVFSKPLSFVRSMKPSTAVTAAAVVAIVLSGTADAMGGLQKATRWESRTAQITVSRCQRCISLPARLMALPPELQASISLSLHRLQKNIYRNPIRPWTKA